MTNELTHYYHLGESTFIFGDIRCDFMFVHVFFFFDEIPISEQNSPTRTPGLNELMSSKSCFSSLSSHHYGTV